jgi:hypothetical protein
MFVFCISILRRRLIFNIQDVSAVSYTPVLRQLVVITLSHLLRVGKSRFDQTLNVFNIKLVYQLPDRWDGPVNC